MKIAFFGVFLLAAACGGTVERVSPTVPREGVADAPAESLAPDAGGQAPDASSGQPEAGTDATDDRSSVTPTPTPLSSSSPTPSPSPTPAGPDPKCEAIPGHQLCTLVAGTAPGVHDGWQVDYLGCPNGKPWHYQDPSDPLTAVVYREDELAGCGPVVPAGGSLGGAGTVWCCP